MRRVQEDLPGPDLEMSTVYAEENQGSGGVPGFNRPCSDDPGAGCEGEGEVRRGEVCDGEFPWPRSLPALRTLHELLADVDPGAVTPLTQVAGKRGGKK